MSTTLAQPGPRPILGLSPRTCRIIRLTALAWSVAMVGLLALSSRIELLDAQPGGKAFELEAKPYLMASFAIGAVLAWWWALGGAIVASFSAAGLSAFALGQLERPSALLVLTGFIVPGCLLLLLALHDRGPRIAIIAVVGIGIAVVIGAAVSYRVYDDLYGPSHPSSTTAALPPSDLQWVWSGGVTAHEATVVAKLDDGSEARLLVSTQQDLRQPIRSEVTSADPHHVVRLRVRDLEPDTTYHYAVEVEGRADLVRTGQFRTFGEEQRSITVAIGSCARVGSNGAVFDAIRSLDPDLFVIDGDWNYANLTDNDPGDFREVLDETLTRPAQAALYRSVPVAYVWDDHDYGRNNADATSSTRPAAMSVYREYVPHYRLAGDDAPVYQAFTIGRVRFIVTDGRADRTPATAPDDEQKSILGPEQRAWLERELLAAHANFALTVWVNPTPWIGAPSIGSDTWAGYSTERREIADFIADNGIDRLVMLSGDAHMVAIDDGTNTDYSTSGGAAFPLLHAAALDRPGKIKGGPYSIGAIPGGGQFGVLEVEDLGSTLAIRLTGRNWRGESLLSHQFGVAVPPL